ncbi:MAG: OadG family protein [Clostridium sp.]|uniref:OadG family protein n=1 Tax=Clostridium sp. TaxID=1506 RepID=UPI003035C8AF
MEGTMGEKLGFAIGTSATAMIIVFGMLVILMLIIKFQSGIINGIGNKKKSTAKPVGKDRDAVLTEVAQGAQVIDLNADCELVAAIMAALSAHTGKSAGQLNINSIKRVNNNNSNWRNASINK